MKEGDQVALVKYGDSPFMRKGKLIRKHILWCMEYGGGRFDLTETPAWEVDFTDGVVVVAETYLTKLL